LAIAVAWFMARREKPMEAGLYMGTATILLAGTLVWGARLNDFNTIPLFFGGIAGFATPVAAVAVWSLWLRLRDTGHERVATAVLVLCGTQLVLGVALSIVRLEVFGPGAYPAVAVPLLAEIRRLPSDAKLAYACQPFEESTFWNARLLALDAHTGRRVVPMCFESEILGVLTGGRLSEGAASAVYEWAPQRELYPGPDAQPTSASVASFLEDNGIDYIYADATHPNTLVPEAIPIEVDGLAQVLRIP
jgi:hypothetical protein